MAKPTKTEAAWLRGNVQRLARIHFLFVGAIVVQIILYDVWKLLTPDAVMKRWIIAAILLLVTTICWYLSKEKLGHSGRYRALVFSLILVDVVVASFLVYVQRGMASQAVALYAIPIVVSSVLLSRAAIMATAFLCTAAYTTTAISYFVLNFNEGYKIELYGEIGFYSVIFFVIAWCLWTLVKSKRRN
ncbi:MAG: hypothetical protein ABI354_00280 [Candidatus Saccharimonadales bacterium]